jgi:hypothetical protein
MTDCTERQTDCTERQPAAPDYGIAGEGQKGMIKRAQS